MKYKLTFTFIIALFMGIVSCHALSEEDYNRLRLLYSDEYISIMSEEQINRALAMDLENSKQVKVYYKGISNLNNGSYTWTEETEEEYNQANEIMPINEIYEENHKYILLAVTPSGTAYDFYFIAHWKYMPAARSYDVLAFRFYNVALYTDSQTGTQLFRIEGDDINHLSHVDYGPNGTNIKKYGQNFGISMNLVNNDINYLELSIDCLGKPSSSNPQVWASYQHAITDISLTQSQNYTISAAGMGKVINYDPSVVNYFNEMPGLTHKIA